MSKPAIRVENLGKMYRIGGPVERYRTFRDTVAQGFARTGRRVRSWFGGGNGAAPKYETIWALKDVSFEIQPGEVIGVIGRIQDPLARNRQWEDTKAWKRSEKLRIE